jgi:carbamoyl-phosphate synthase large subunit
VSAPETVDISRNKTLTHSWLSERGFPVPRQSTPEQILAQSSEWQLPLIVKPNGGSASIGVHVVHSFQALDAAAKSTEGLIVQELIAGREHTVNVFLNNRGQCICAVPHYRIEVRAGEVSKAVTVKHLGLMQMVRRLVEMLPGAYGALNVQCFLTASDEIRIIEVNARFGGGYPLAHMAGAKMTQWLLEDIRGAPPKTYYDDWQDGLLMLRYDDAVFSTRSDAAMAKCRF